MTSAEHRAKAGRSHAKRAPVVSSRTGGMND